MTTEHEHARTSVWLVLPGLVILAAALALGIHFHGALKAAVPHLATTAQTTVVTAASSAGRPGVAASGAVAHMLLTPSAAAGPAMSEPSVKVDDGVVRFYFAHGKAQLAAGAEEALATIVKGVAAGKTAVISVYRAATGSDSSDAPGLADERAQAVRSALMALGIGADKLVLRGIDETMTAGSDAETDRVDVTLEG